MWQRHINKIKLLKEDQIVQLVFSDVSETQEKKKNNTQEHKCTWRFQSHIETLRMRSS